MTRKRYTDEYKQQAVELSHSPGNTVAGVARDLQIPENNLWRWREQYPITNGTVARRKSVLTPEQEEIRRLKREIAKITEERDILKKTIFYFSHPK